ncbi:hypothetical protein GCK72_008854 [Caenorhabditis remanei]|uniref:Uncharacterized protein n=2 Tax=Caenorhabditis remanei TaxID=31234 RepID=E3M8D9_CAERE|nr:hypothetical protein GCK72_008854 [Caenorhabditis remanei]EFO94447.1 hypothetical protein CRE_13360 [Caenorhabditis remanei]KAF1760605.1 hypothetical protein GCK72_008854 [Caenorhabditis remanei]
MSVAMKCFYLLVLLAVMTVATWQNEEDTGCAGAEGCDEETNNKFALLFRQMLAKQREANVDCTVTEDCPESFDCVSGKCRSMGPRRTKMFNLYSRW